VFVLFGGGHAADRSPVLEKGYRFSISCPRRTTVRVIYGGFAEAVIAKGKGDEPLAALFERGKFVCGKHRVPAEFPDSRLGCRTP
jgi:hypothetical protein